MNAFTSYYDLFQQTRYSKSGVWGVFVEEITRVFNRMH